MGVQHVCWRETSRKEILMKTFKVIYKERLAHEFYIDAESRTEAEREFYRKANNGEIDFSNGEVCDTHMNIVEEGKSWQYGREI